jgi:alpha-ketoglutarate-dependent taurine dioxygenase
MKNSATSTSVMLDAPGNPFHPDNQVEYERWRAWKLSDYPRRIEDIIVQVNDPRSLTPTEHEAIRALCHKANMALYASACGPEPDKDIPRKLGAQFGLLRLDSNLLSDEDSITSLTVAEAGDRTDFIPYTNQPIKWHTDGYYNPPDRQIQGMLLHCVQSSATGGENALIDHEIVYILLRDEDPDFIRALMQPDAMTIPARMSGDAVARAAEAGPVFSIVPGSGNLHMRYTARTRSIAWKNDPVTAAAVAFLQQTLGSDSPYIFRGRLEPGMGLICNNVLHDRSGFLDDTLHKRLLYRARYYDRMQGTDVPLPSASPA